MQTVQPCARISRVFPDVVDVQRVPTFLEISRKHFLTSIIEFTFPGLCVKIDAEAFGVKFTAIGAYLKTCFLHRIYHVTNQLVVFDRLDSATQVNGMNGEQEQETGYKRHCLQRKPFSYQELSRFSVLRNLDPRAFVTDHNDREPWERARSIFSRKIEKP